MSSTSSSTSSSIPTLIKVYQYNVLAQSLSSIFEVEQQSHLKEEIRKYLLEQAFLKMIDEEAIICLQEVENDYFCYLFTFFREYNYTIVFSAYNGVYCGNMGIAMAVPSKYDIDELSIKYVCSPLSKLKKSSDIIQYPTIAEKILNISSSIIQSTTQTLSGTFDYMKSLFVTPDLPAPVLPNPWLRAKQKWNTVIMMKLKYQEKDFCVATVHYPCEFNNPKVMNIFHLLLMKQLQDFCQDIPCILAGDFNFCPDNILFNLIRGKVDDWSTNVLNPNNDTLSINELENFKPLNLTDYFFETVYDNDTLNNGFTNNSKWKNKPAFKGLIDYIFYRNLHLKGFEIINEQEDKMSPNLKEPSDHYKVCASFSI